MAALVPVMIGSTFLGRYLNSSLGERGYAYFSGPLCAGIARGCSDSRPDDFLTDLPSQVTCWSAPPRRIGCALFWLCVNNSRVRPSTAGRPGRALNGWPSMLAARGYVPK